jgi:opacity protein-like surface antigen
MGRPRLIATTLFILAAMSIIAAPLAQAAAYYYANQTPSSEWQYRYSGQQSQIKGGRAFTEPFSADGATVTVGIETYYPAPGYTTVGYAAAGENVYLNHNRVSNARQKCVWQWPWAGGPGVGHLDLTCYKTS